MKDIIADVDEATREVVLTIHWRGGQHSEVRMLKPRSGEHGCRTPEEALAIMRSMAGKMSDEHIAASRDRMGLPTGQGKTLTAHRVASVRMVNDIRLPLRAKGRRVADVVGGSSHARRDQSLHPAPRKVGAAGGETGRGESAVPNPSQRSARSEGNRGSLPNRSPVSQRWRKPARNVFKHLTKGALCAGHRDAAQRPLGGVVGQADPAVVEEPSKGRPALQHIVHGLGGVGMT